MRGKFLFLFRNELGYTHNISLTLITQYGCHSAQAPRESGRSPQETPEGPQRGTKGGQEGTQVGKGSCGWYPRGKKKRKKKKVKERGPREASWGLGEGRRVLLSPRGVPGRCTEGQKKVQLVTKEERKMELENGPLKKAPRGPGKGPMGARKGT
jgi:hypothetical protein